MATRMAVYHVCHPSYPVVHVDLDFDTVGYLSDSGAQRPARRRGNGII